MEISRESIFTSAIRSFCKTLFGVLGILVAIMLGFIGSGLLSKPYDNSSQVEMIIEPDAKDQSDLLPATAPVILRIDIHGPILSPNLSGRDVEIQLTQAHMGFLKMRDIKGILLHMNTPGGAVVDGDTIYRAIARYKAQFKVPVYAYVDGMCASAGMYIGMAADKIYASSVSLVGSIGCTMPPAFNFWGLMQKVGIDSRTISRGKDKELIPAFRPWEPREDESLVAIMDYYYNQFVNLVVGARPQIDRDKLINEYGAQVYAAEAGKSIGFVDESDASYQSTLAALAAAAGIPDQESYQVIRLKPWKGILGSLADQRNSLFPWMATDKEMAAPFLYLFNPNG